MDQQELERQRVQWAVSQAVAEVRQTGTIAAVAFLVTAAILSSVDWLDSWRWLLIVSMVAAVLAALNAAATMWSLILDAGKSVLTSGDQAKLDRLKRKFSADFASRGALYSFWLSAISLVVFLIRNFW